MKKKKEEYYAKVMWSKHDVHSLRENWTLEECEEWLSENEGYLAERLTELGWDVIDNLITLEDDEKYGKSNSVKFIKSTK